MLLGSVAACTSSGSAGSGDAGASDSTTKSTSFSSFNAESTSTAATVRVPASHVKAGETPDFCQVIPVDTVARILRQTISKSVTVSVPHAGGMCTYRDSAAGAPKVRAVVDVRRGQTAASAGATLFAMRAQDGTSGIAATDVPGLGDAAYGASDTTGSYVVKAQSGPFVILVTVAAPGTAQQALRAGATELARQALTALQ